VTTCEERHKQDMTQHYLLYNRPTGSAVCVYPRTRRVAALDADATSAPCIHVRSCVARSVSVVTATTAACCVIITIRVAGSIDIVPGMYNTCAWAVCAIIMSRERAEKGRRGRCRRGC